MYFPDTFCGKIWYPFFLDILLYDAVSLLESEILSYTPMWEEWKKKNGDFLFAQECNQFNFFRLVRVFLRESLHQVKR